MGINRSQSPHYLALPRGEILVKKKRRHATIGKQGAKGDLGINRVVGKLVKRGYGRLGEGMGRPNEKTRESGYGMGL